MAWTGIRLGLTCLSASSTGVVQPGPGVCAGRILRPERGQRVSQTPVLPPRPAQSRRQRGNDRPHPAPLQLRLLRLPRAREQVRPTAPLFECGSFITPRERRHALSAKRGVCVALRRGGEGRCELGWRDMSGGHVVSPASKRPHIVVCFYCLIEHFFMCLNCYFLLSYSWFCLLLLVPIRSYVCCVMCVYYLQMSPFSMIFLFFCFSS